MRRPIYDELGTFSSSPSPLPMLQRMTLGSGYTVTGRCKGTFRLNEPHEVAAVKRWLSSGPSA